jgi:hypothetical protein
MKNRAGAVSFILTLTGPLVAVALVIGGIFLSLVVFLPIGSACTTLADHEIMRLKDLRFRFIEVNCDSLAKDSSVSLVASQDDRGQEAIFKYDPIDSDPTPVVGVDDEGNISISIRGISSISVQEKNWNGHVIKYEIGKARF